MPSPQTLLPWILGGVIGVGGILQGLHWRSSTAPADTAGLADQLRLVGEENEMLRRENESLRSLTQGGGEFSVPQDWINLVEKEFGLRYHSSPVVHRLAGEELRDRIGASFESRFGPSGIEDRQEAYRLIGWLRADDDLLGQLAAVRSMTALGWFDDMSGEAWVTDRFDLKNVPDQALMIRLLTRILFYQHFPSPPAYPGDDADRARTALHEGAAAGAEARFMAMNARTIGFMPMTKHVELSQLLASLSPFMQGLTSFPALEGKNFADALYVKGNDALHSAFRSPPHTTQNILFPDENDSEIEPLDLPSVPEDAFLVETGGSLGLRLWLLASIDASASGEIAASWKADAYALFPDGEQSVAVIWEIELKDVEAADRFQILALKRVSEMAGTAEAAVSGATIKSKENRYLRLTRPAPTRLRFLNTFEAQTATKLGDR